MSTAHRPVALSPEAATRWVAPLFSPHAPPALAIVAAACKRARRIVAARVALACARERIVDATLQGDSLVLAEGLALPLARRRALELHVPDLEIERDPVLDDPLALWSSIAVRLGVPDDARARVAAELADGVDNLALALVAVHWRRELAELAPADPRVVDGEHVVVEGHPWHPMAKTRLGLRTSEVLRHAPEWLADAPIVAVDVPEPVARVSGPWADTIAPVVGRASTGFVRIPVHAAQWRRVAGLGGGALQPRGVVAHGRALLSVRTVDVPDSGLHLKLALDVHTTSARRTVSPMSVANGACVTALLARIAHRDPIARGEPELVVMGEPAAAGLDPAAFGDDARRVGAIARDAAALGGEPAYVCASLGDRWPDGTVVIERLAEWFQGSPRTAGRALARSYMKGLVPPVLRMLVAHGIALEVHLQNTLVRWSRGAPARFVVRDLGGIRLHRGRLAAAGHSIDLDPSSFIVTDDLDEVVGKFVHSLVHAHMSTLFGWVEDVFGVDADENWSHLESLMSSLLERWSAEEPALAAACDHTRVTLFAPRCRAKALLRMRIDDRSSDYEYVELDNPLFDPFGRMHRASKIP